ncbi:MAG: glycoside hydrolase family protein [Rikenellaceae bacterium]
MKILSLLAGALALCSTLYAQEKPKDVSYEIKFGKIPMTAVYKNGDDDKWSVWGASMVKGEDNLYHIFYSRWLKAPGWSWEVDSEIAHATSKSPYGPWEFSDVALTRRGKEYWDGWCAHNPTIHKFDGKYYLYYMGNTGDGKVLCTPEKRVLNWTHRNNQRIGVAVADSPYGPWTRYDKPLIDISPEKDAPDHLATSNPSMCKMPDGRYLFVYKAIGAKLPPPQGGPVTHMVAIADSPTGPVVKQEKLAFYVEGEVFGAEDPYIWYSDGAFRAIVKRIMKDENGKQLHYLYTYESKDGLDWRPSRKPIVSKIEIFWEDGTHMPLTHLDRPQVYLENGQPKLILCAADTTDRNNVTHSFNVQMPLHITKHPMIE